MNQMLINVGFSLSEPLHSNILETSQAIRKTYASDWYLDDIKYHLHFPMYLIAIPQKNEGKIEGVSEEYIKNCRPVDVQIKDLFFNKSGLLMIKFDITEQLRELHKLSLKLFNPLREGILREKYLEDQYLNRLKPEVQKYVIEYGSEYILENYIPHVTIARIKDLDMQKEILSTYKSKLLGLNGKLDRLQVHTAVFSDNKDEDRTILLYDKQILSKKSAN